MAWISVPSLDVSEKGWIDSLSGTAPPVGRDSFEMFMARRKEMGISKAETMASPPVSQAATMLVLRTERQKKPNTY